MKTIDIIIFSLFSFFTLSILILGWSKKIVFLSIFSGITFMVIGAFILSNGLSITYSGAYALPCCNDTQQGPAYGIALSTVSFTDPLTNFLAGALMFLGLGSFILSIAYALKTEEVDKSG